MNNVGVDGMNRHEAAVHEAALHELRITELSPTEWRICDDSDVDGDPSAVLGFIQQVGGAYEVTDLGRLRERTYFSTFERAASSFAGRTVMS